MAYTPTEWETGDVITAEKLNNIEDGIVANEEAIEDNAPMIVTLTYAGAPDDAPVLSVTVDELYAAVSAHKDVRIYAIDSTETLSPAILAIQAYNEAQIPDVGPLKIIAATSMIHFTAEPLEITWLIASITSMGISVTDVTQS